MKKLNKKGFTLAELLIVIAIIAILIAIAIPAFSASLYSARLQTDHANIRAAYAMARTAEMLGVMDGPAGTTIDVSNLATHGSDVYVFMVDGSIAEKTGLDKTKAYQLKVDAKTGDCVDSLGCAAGGHVDENYITIQHTTEWKVVLDPLA